MSQNQPGKLSLKGEGELEQSQRGYQPSLKVALSWFWNHENIIQNYNYERTNFLKKEFLKFQSKFK